MPKIFNKNGIILTVLLSLLLSAGAVQNISHAQIGEPSPAQDAAMLQKAADARKAADAAAANKIVKLECPFGSTAVYDKSLAVKYNISLSTIVDTLMTPYGALWNPPVSLGVVEDPKGCIIPAASKSSCDAITGAQAYYQAPSGAIDFLSGADAKFLGCTVPPSKTIRAGDVANTKITQGVRAYKMQVPIPCQPLAGGQCPNIETGPTLANYITRLYQFGLMIVGLFAFAGIVYGAFKYILSAGSMADQSDAKDQITQAITGLVLLLSAYTILYTINPRLVSLSDPELAPINVSELAAPPEDIGQTSQIAGSQTGSVDPLCKYNVNLGIDIRFNTSLGTVGGPQSGSMCVSCKDNASKGASGCGCNPGFVLNDNACVSEQQLLKSQEACSKLPNSIWRNGKCIKA